jgi:hypothetical protein
MKNPGGGDLAVSDRQRRRHFGEETRFGLHLYRKKLIIYWICKFVVLLSNDE